MDIQDRKKSLTAEELRQRYNLEDIGKNKKAIQMQKDAITKLDTHLEEFVEATTETLEELQDQVDGNITTWFYSGVPTLLNEPAVEWTTTEEKNRHLGDLYYDQSTGYAYRFAKQTNQFIWLKLTDSDVTEALRIANEAQDTADNKRRVFTTTPTPPYDVGDLWLNNEELYVCSTARESGSYTSGDFEIATKYTDDSALTTFINGSYATTISNLETSIDGKSETYYQSADPSSTWTTTTEKDKHIGDLWYNTTANKSYIYTKSGSTYSWEEADGVPQSVYDKIDGKAQIFSSQPTPPYYAKDLWVQGSTGDIKHCVQTRITGSFNANDWVLSSKYTDDSSLNTFVNVTYAAAMENLTNQIDGKISTWYYSGVPTLSNLPASEWDDDEKLEHTGDLYYDRATGYCYMFVYEDSTYKWNRIEDSAITDALAVANAAQDTADSKRRVFVTTPTPPYDIGDIWIKEDKDLYRCKTATQAGGTYSESHWTLATNYTDDTVATQAIQELNQFKVDVQETYATSADLITTANSINGRVDETYTYITTVETNTNNQIADITNATQNIDGNNSIYIEDAIQDNVIYYNVDGSTSQDGTPTPDSPVDIETIPSIINLFDKENTNWYRNGNSAFSNTTNTSTSRIRTNSFLIKGGKSYTISGMPNGISLVAVRTYETNGGENLGNATLSGNKITLNSNVNYINIVFGGSNFTDSTNELMKNTNLMLEEGSIAHEYVPYGYWSKVKVTGKNIFNEVFQQGGLNTSNGNTTSSNARLRTDFISVSPSTTYSVSSGNDNIDNFNACYYDSTRTFVSALGTGWKTFSNSITIPSNAKYVRLFFRKSDDSNIAPDGNYQIQLEQGNQATTYEPYKENQVLIDMSKENLFDNSKIELGINWYAYANTKRARFYVEYIPNKPYTICFNSIPSTVNGISIIESSSLTNSNGNKYSIDISGTQPFTHTFNSEAQYLIIQYKTTVDVTQEIANNINMSVYESNNPTPYYELCKIGDYKDILSVDSNGNVSISKNIRKRVLNGSESGWNATSGNVYITIDNSTKTTALSNYFSYNSNASSFGEIKWSSSQPWLIFLGASTQYGLSGFKTWLSTHNTSVYYPLATPETINLPNATIPLFEGINHITFMDDLETSTNVTYYRQTPLSDTYATQKQLNDVSTQKTQEIIQVRNEVQAEITSTQASINVINETIENGVSKVNGTGYTFDSDGLKIEKTNQDVKSLLDNDGLAVSYQNTELLTVRSNGIEAENMTVRKFYVQKPIRMEKTKSISDGSSVGLGFFYVGE